MSEPLITNLVKKPSPLPPGELMPGSAPPTAVVGASDSVPIELHLTGIERPIQVGLDIVFLIDNSGSMGPDAPHSDPFRERFRAVLEIINAFEVERNQFDRIAIILFGGGQSLLPPRGRYFCGLEELE